MSRTRWATLTSHRGLILTAAYLIRRCTLCGTLFRDRTKNYSGRRCSKACRIAYASGRRRLRGAGLL